MLKVWKYVEKEQAVSAKAIAMDNEQDNIDFGVGVGNYTNCRD